MQRIDGTDGRRSDEAAGFSLSENARAVTCHPPADIIAVARQALN
jgi:hypothetical protein